MIPLVHRLESRFLATFAALGSRCRCAWLRHRGHDIGRGVRIGKGVLIEGEPGQISLGAGTVIHPGARLIAAGGQIRLGRNCSVNPGCILYGHGGLLIGDNDRIAAHCILVPANHRFEDAAAPICEQGESREGISIGSDVWLGAASIVLDGVRLADGCVIGAGAVVTKSTVAFGVYVGNPARHAKSRGVSDGRDQ